MREFFKRDLTPYVIIGFIVLVIISALITHSRPLSYTMSVSKKPQVSLPVTVDFEVQKQMAYYSPDKFEVTLTHKYNSNETYDFDLKPYEPGKYEFIFTPKYSGEYLVTLTLESEGNTQLFSESIDVAE